MPIRTTESGRRRCRRTKASQEARTTTPTRACLWWKPGVAKGERLDRNEGTVCPIGENDFGDAMPKLAILAVKPSNIVKSPIRTAASNVVAIVTRRIKQMSVITTRDSILRGLVSGPCTLCRDTPKLRRMCWSIETWLLLATQLQRTADRQALLPQQKPLHQASRQALQPQRPRQWTDQSCTKPRQRLDLQRRSYQLLASVRTLSCFATSIICACFQIPFFAVPMLRLF